MLDRTQKLRVSLPLHTHKKKEEKRRVSFPGVRLDLYGFCFVFGRRNICVGVLSIFLSLAQLMRQSVPSVGVYAHRRTNGLSRRSTHRLTDATQERGRRGCVYARVSCRGVSFDPSGARYPAVVSFASSTVSDEIKARKTAWADRHATPPPVTLLKIAAPS